MITPERRKEMNDAIQKGKREGMAKRKEAFLIALSNNYGVLTHALREADLDRNTYYAWTKNDPEFVERVAEVQEQLLDLGERMLIKKLQEEDTQVILHFAKSKLKNRGYSEKTEVQQTGEIVIRIVEDNTPDA